MKLYRILGKRGRVTIPYEIRQRVGFKYNDVLSFTEQDDRTVIVKREKVCDDCREREEKASLQEFLAGLTREQQEEVNRMRNQNGKSQMVPEARGALDNMKYEIARELGVDYQQAYKGNLSARENGYVGGYMVKRLIEKAEKSMSNQQ